MRPKRGQIFLWSGNNPIAWGIQRFTRSRWSHCGWFISEDKILDSDYGFSKKTWGVQIRDAGPYLKYLGRPKRLRIATLPLSPEETEKALQKALSHVGRTGYDYKLIFHLALHILRGRRCSDDVRDWKDAFVCSEIIAKPCFEAAGFRFIDGCYDIDATTPHDIYEKATLL